MVLKGFFDIVENFPLKMGDSNKEDKNKEQPLYTEEDILKAIDALPVEEPEPLGYTKEELNCEVKEVKIWSSFEYLSEPPSGNTPEDKKFFYIVPTGLEYGEETKAWYLGVYFNASINDIFEFYTTHNNPEPQSPDNL